MNDVTKIVQSLQDEPCHAAEDLLPLVYDELRKLAKSRLRYERAGQTLQPTALVHEAYLRLVGNEDPKWDGRGHFFAAAARAMRQILVERARNKNTLKRGGERQRVTFENANPALEPPSNEVLAVDEAIKRLEQVDPRKGQIVNLRYFARMTAAETATVLGCSLASVRRDWLYIKAWLESELSDVERK